MDILSDIPLKRCSKCRVSKPSTSEYFHRCKTIPDGWYYQCKQCRREDRPRFAEREKAYNESRLGIRREWGRNHRANNPEYYRQKASRGYYANIEKKHAEMRSYYQAHKQERCEYNRQYHADNLEQRRAYMRHNAFVKRDDRKAYREKTKEQTNVWRKLPEVATRIRANMRIIASRRRARQRALPDTFTKEQWLHCLEYFSYQCVACNADFSEDTRSHMDHWIPLSSPECTGTIATNMICLCATCNISKGGHPPSKWLALTFEDSQAQVILERVQHYFNSLMDNTCIP